MSKGYQANLERQEEVGRFGKAVGKRAGFKCEWCEGRDDLRVWDYRPESDPAMESLALLCQRCREWAAGHKPDPKELRSIRNALWSDIPAISEGAARVLVRCTEPWAREAVEESLIDDKVKSDILG